MPVQIGGGNAIVLSTGATIDGVITGFDAASRITYAGGSVQGGTNAVTAAEWRANGDGTGTLTLSDDGVAVASLVLAGDYTGARFVTTALGSPNTVALVVRTQAGLAGPTLVGATSGYLAVTGTGTSPTLGVAQNVAVYCAFATGQLAVAPGSNVSGPNSLLIEAGGSVSATSAVIGRAQLEVDGPGAALRVQGQLTFAYGNNLDDAIVVANGGVVQVGALAVSAGDDFPRRTFTVDPTASLEVGSAGGAAAGTLTVDPGAVLLLAGEARIEAALVVNGTLALSGTGGVFTSEVSRGVVTGSGGIAIGAHAELDVAAISGLGSVALSSGSLVASGDVTGVGALTAGGGSSVQVGGALAGGSVVVGAAGAGPSASLVVKGDASGTGPLTLLNADARFDGAVTGFGTIVDGPGSVLRLFGSAAPPIVMQANAALGGSTLEIGRGVGVGGPVNGFAAGDTIAFRSDNGATIVTDAVWTKGAGRLGTLTLSDDGAVVGTLSLVGDYSGAVFVTNYAGAAGVTNITVADPAVPVPVPPAAVTDPLFDAAYYLAANPDVAVTGADPYQHYLAVGWKEGRDPSAVFGTRYYLSHTPDVAAAGVNPLLRYVVSGQAEGRAAFAV